MDYKDLPTNELMQHMQQLQDALKQRLFDYNNNPKVTDNVTNVSLEQNNPTIPSPLPSTSHSRHMHLEYALDAYHDLSRLMFHSYIDRKEIASNKAYSYVKDLYYHLTFLHLTK
jgi:hypothetical protein